MSARIDRYKIGVLGLAPGAGAGFISVFLARELAETGVYHPAVLETGGHGLYDILAMDKHFAGREYFRFFDAVTNGKSIRGKTNELYGVNWILRSPEESGAKTDLLEVIRMMNHASGDMIICKISCIRDEDLWKLLADMDKVLVVIDPLPSKMLAGYKLLCKLRTSGLPVVYTVNKMNGGVSRMELRSYLKLKNLLCFPMLDQEIVYGAEYSCRPAYDMPLVKSVVKRPLEGLLRELFAIWPAGE